jgi:hypothetical protein
VLSENVRFVYIHDVKMIDYQQKKIDRILLCSRLYFLDNSSCLPGLRHRSVVNENYLPYFPLHMCLQSQEDVDILCVREMFVRVCLCLCPWSASVCLSVKCACVCASGCLPLFVLEHLFEAKLRNQPPNLAILPGHRI